MKKNIDMKKKMRKQMLKMNQKQELGYVEGENEKMQGNIKKHTSKPITFTQDNKINYDPDNMYESDDSKSETFDFQKDDERQRNVKDRETRTIHETASRRNTFGMRETRMPTGVNTKAQVEYMELVDRKYGPEHQRQNLNKKTMERVLKLEQKKAQNIAGKKQSRGITTKDKIEAKQRKQLANRGQEFDFINDYSSSDYEYNNQEEIDHL